LNSSLTTLGMTDDGRKYSSNLPKFKMPRDPLRTSHCQR